MATENFAKIMSQIFLHEGGYVDHPADPGGATNMGITQATLSEWRGKKVTKSDVKSLTKDEACAIYKKRYWDVINGDQLPSGVDYVLMDVAVNSGTRRAVQFANSVTGSNLIHTAFDVKLVAELNALDRIKCINAICDARMAFLKRLPTFKTFGRGWSRRVEEVRSFALKL